jgi:hypothetical protein
MHLPCDNLLLAERNKEAMIYLMEYKLPGEQNAE